MAGHKRDTTEEEKRKNHNEINTHTHTEKRKDMTDFKIKGFVVLAV